MKVELHCHTSRYSGCAAHSPEKMLARLVATGYEAVYVTEHDAVWSDRELDDLRGRFPDIRIFPGMELSPFFFGSYHLLVLGSNDPAYLAIRKDAEILDKARAEGHLTVLAHPFRWAGGDDMLKAGLRPDALEHQTPNVEPIHSARAAQAADEYDLPLVNSGDVHAVSFINRFWIETRRPVEAATDIRGIVLDGAYENRAGDERAETPGRESGGGGAGPHLCR